MNSVVLLLKSTEHGGNDLQQNTAQSSQGTYWELHTWYPYENSERCNPAEGTELCRCSLCEIWAILGEAIYLEDILVRIFTDVQCQC
jgi:hypothetical protein